MKLTHPSSPRKLTVVLLLVAMASSVLLTRGEAKASEVVDAFIDPKGCEITKRDSVFLMLDRYYKFHDKKSELPTISDGLWASILKNERKLTAYLALYCPSSKNVPIVMSFSEGGGFFGSDRTLDVGCISFDRTGFTLRFVFDSQTNNIRFVLQAPEILESSTQLKDPEQFCSLNH